MLTNLWEMKRVIAAVFAFGLVIGSTGGVASAKTYKNCTELTKKYKNGVAKSKSAAGSTKAHVSAAIYAQNKKMDRDNDGVACES